MGRNGLREEIEMCSRPTVPLRVDASRAASPPFLSLRDPRLAILTVT